MSVGASRAGRVPDISNSRMLRGLNEGNEGGTVLMMPIPLDMLSGLLAGQAEGAPGGAIEFVAHTINMNVNGSLEYWFEILTSDKADGSGNQTSLLTMQLPAAGQLVSMIDTSTIATSNRYIAVRGIVIGEGDSPSYNFALWLNAGLAR